MLQTNVDTSIRTSAHLYINKFVRPFFAAALILMIVLAFVSDGIFDTGDGILHYQIARWSWKHPELFLHHWGKPVYTLLCSPFAQAGYKGAVIFNIMCHIGAAWLAWRIADRMKLPYAFLAGPLVVFAPVSWGVAQSGLTEPLFALTLMSGIYFITAGRYTVAACLISLLPFVRTEGFVLAPLFGIFFILRKEYLAMSLLASGTLLYSIIGTFAVHHDFLWVLHQNPYRGEEMYGHGPLLHFVNNNEFIFGWALTALIALGLISVFFRNKLEPRHSITEITLIFGCFVLFFAAHSLFWWKGIVGSLGLLRVMACIVPCGVLVGLRGLQLLVRAYQNYRVAVTLTLAFTVITTIFNTFRQHNLILKADISQQTIQQVCTNIRNLKLDNRKIYYGHPLVTHYLDKDPFDMTQCFEMWGIRQDPNLQKGAIVIWDSHFGPQQYDVTEEQLLGMPQLTEVSRVERTNDSAPKMIWIVCEVK